jgi:hypothetical protein
MEDTKQRLETARSVSVGIWDNCEDTITCYPDRSIARIHYVNWQNNTGTLDVRRLQITGNSHDQVRKALLDECDDSAWAAIYE